MARLRGWLLEDLASGNRTLLHATQAGEPCLDCERISTTTCPLTVDCLTTQMTIPLIIVCKTQLS